ncbi:uncharacterized protein LOC102807351 [Saccoglossus kowalevskii]|uniref:Uncharacterized protein LOC102807351 n=1 Tax=Saccoglossus kowalevskii TaxID=10224 RepID=A0ABM0M3B1_SACKO|nr:PREDICTED: uncharacterized protein LOC102807351 [Saccoglossus kowalevskii]
MVEVCVQIRFVFLSMLVLKSSTLQCDLEIYEFSMSNPYPDDTSTDFLQNVDTVVRLATFYVRNNGPDDLPTSGADNNYDVKMYISAISANGNMIDPIKVTTFNISSSIDNLAASLDSTLTDSSSNHFFISSNYLLRYPGEKCSTHSHLCLMLVEDQGVYTDDDVTNNMACLRFANGPGGNAAGLTNCPPDIIPSFLHIFSDVSNFTYASRTDVTMQLILRNAGGGKIVSANEANELKVFVSSATDEDATTVYDLSGSLIYLNGDVNAVIGEWAEVTLELKATLYIPSYECYKYKYFCVKFLTGPDATLNEDDTNNVICHSFGDGIGYIECPDETMKAANHAATTLSAPITTRVLTVFIIATYLT